MEKFINNNSVVQNTISDEYKNYIKCAKCLNILINPLTCSNCHLIYCKKCIEGNVPCKNCSKSYYTSNIFINDILSNLQFTCLICHNIISYYETKNHYIIYHEDEIESENLKDYDFEIITIVKKMESYEMASIGKQIQNIMRLTSKRNY